MNLDADLSIGEAFDGGTTQRNPQLFNYLSSQLATQSVVGHDKVVEAYWNIGSAREHFHVLEASGNHTPLHAAQDSVGCVMLRYK